MGESTDQIETHIRSERDDLQSNLEELEDRVRAAADWRKQFRRHPAAMLGLAVAGGVLIGRATRLRRPRATEPAVQAYSRPRHFARAWDELQGALVGVMMSKLKSGLVRMLPARNGHSFSDADTPGDGMSGEGNYAAARNHRRQTERFVASADIPRAAREAAPMSAYEAEQLAAAEKAGRERAKN
jgi:hypothetical protein